MNRRNFLKTAFVGLATITIPSVLKGDFISDIDGNKWNPNLKEKLSKNNFINYSELKKIQVNTKSVVSNTILYGDGNKELNRSKQLVGYEEIKIFMDYFNLKNSRKFTLKVKFLQKLFGLKSDGIIGNKTLFMLYENYYIPNKENFNFSIKQHIENRENDLVWIKNIKFEMSKYPNKRSNNGVLPKSGNFLRILDKKIYGDRLSLNKAGTFIDRSLYENIPHNISNKANKIYVENYYGKKILRVYNEGKLEVACYVSPGKKLTITPIYKKSLPGSTDMYHASSNREYRGAVMPYGVLVDSRIGIYLHGSSDIIDGKGRSHGCIRVPLFYQKKLYELVNLGISFDIDTSKIYSSGNPDFENIILSENLY